MNRNVSTENVTKQQLVTLNQQELRHVKGGYSYMYDSPGNLTLGYEGWPCKSLDMATPLFK